MRQETYRRSDDEYTTKVTDEGIEALVLARKDAIKRISLPLGTTDRSLRLVVEKCPRLLELEVWSGLITDAGCEPIKQLRGLKQLTLGPNMTRKYLDRSSDENADCMSLDVSRETIKGLVVALRKIF